MSTKLSLDLDTLSSSALRVVALTLADTGTCRHRGQRQDHYRQFVTWIHHLAMAAAFALVFAILFGWAS
jgi:hypothetical protein